MPKTYNLHFTKSQKSKFSQPSQEIIERCMQRDTEAFRFLVITTQDFAFSIAINILWCKEDAKDAVQESYIKVWNKIKFYNTKKLFTTWMYTIITNTCLDKLRTKKKEVIYEEQNEQFDNKLEQTIINQERIKQIKQLSKGLPHKQRMVFILKDLQDLSISEVSEILKMRTGQVKSNLYYARKALREKIIELDRGRNNDEM